MKRYAVLLMIGVFAALVLTLLPRGPHRAVRPASVPGSATRVTMTVDVYADRVTTVPPTIPVGSPVSLSVTNHTPKPVHLKLAGYEDVVDADDLGPDSTWTVSFDADRPGDQFAWLVNDQPLGRLDVTGSHLVPGHQ